MGHSPPFKTYLSSRRNSLVIIFVSISLLALSISFNSAFLSGALTRAVQNIHRPPPGRSLNESSRPFFFVGILSHPANTARRAKYRSTCLPHLNVGAVPYKFFIGRPSESGVAISQNQGGWATEEEQASARALLKESREHGDIAMGTARDLYRDLTDKVISLYRSVLTTGARYIVKVDDDQCLNATRVRKDLMGVREEAGEDVYGGTHSWAGNEYKSMIGPHGHTAPYMGSMSFLSRRLAHRIFVEDGDVTTSWTINGTTSEDTNMGRWVQDAIERHPEMHVRWIKSPDYVIHFPQNIQGNK